MGDLIMNEFRPGECIRLTAQSQNHAFLPGDRGIVLSGYQASDFGWLSYYVRMQGQEIGMWTIFAAHEIERASEIAVSVNADGGEDKAASDIQCRGQCRVFD